MDHRGTGRGTFLSCEVATSSGSSDLDASQVPTCAKELEEKYGDLAAFSTTSAAMDLKTFISDHDNDFSTTLYGVSYGSMWVERVMHLDPPAVTGYVLDAITTTSGSSVDNFYNISSSDVAFGEIADAFMDLCSEDKSCNARFKKKGLKATMQHLMTKLDANPKSTCSRVLKAAATDPEDDRPSNVLHGILIQLFDASGFRTLIPPIVYRVLRCAKKDVDVLSPLFGYNKQGSSSEDDDDDDLASSILDNLVTFSEMWVSPTPSAKEIRVRYDHTLLGDYGNYPDVPNYCAYSKEKSPTCNKLKLGGYKGNGIIYERDEYWNKAAKIPDQASVLLMTRQLDPSAPSKNAEALLKALEGGKKELVRFGYSSGADMMGSQVDAYCGITVLASFVQGDGDLSKLNKTCIHHETKFNWTTPAKYQYKLLGTEDAYDGDVDSSLGSGGLDDNPTSMILVNP